MDRGRDEERGRGRGRNGEREGEMYTYAYDHVSIIMCYNVNTGTCTGTWRYTCKASHLCCMCMTRNAHTPGHPSSGGCSQPRELCFTDILMYMYIICTFQIQDNRAS